MSIALSGLQVGMCERPGIDAVVTSDECFSFASARVVRRKKVPIHQVPPWNQTPIRTLSCYSRSGFVYVDPKQTC